MKFVEYETAQGTKPIRDFIASLHLEEKATWSVRARVILERLPTQRLPNGWTDNLEGYHPLMEFRFEGRDNPIRIIWTYGQERGDILLIDGFYKTNLAQEKREYKRIFELYRIWKQAQDEKRPSKRKSGGKRK